VTDLLRRIRNGLVRRQYARINRYFRTASPEQIRRSGDRRALKAFHRAARLVPAYQKILREHGVDPGEITTIEQFRRRVPIVDKQALFAAYPLRDLCVGGRLDDAFRFHSSSGHTGVFSFGVEGRDDAAKTALGLEFTLHDRFAVLDRHTLLINCLPMGVTIPTRVVPAAATSVRPDVVLALVEQLKDDFEQILLIGEHLVLKKVIEEGAERGIGWEDLVVHAVTGAEFIAEGFRTYLAGLLGLDFDRPQRGLVLVNFGLSELSLNIFSETAETVGIRRLAYEDAGFREALYGRPTTICPNLMQCYPGQTFLETVEGPAGRSELVVTMLDPGLKAPMVRYNTKDFVELLSYRKLAEVLGDFGHASRLPAARLPLGVIWGKWAPLPATAPQAVYPEQVKEALYVSPEVAGKVTGNFRLGEENGQIVLKVQLRQGEQPRPALTELLTAALKRFAQADVQVRFLPFRQFPFGFAADFGRKNQYF